MKEQGLLIDTHKFPYNWKLSETNFTKDKGKVFSCFACGGGSTMGYKLAGFDVIGCNEIDPKVNQVYVTNHSPRFNFLGDIRTLRERELPPELYNLDILDGSPPCSTFSLSGNREKDWGKEKKFREGQKTQVLDTLFFDFIALAKELQPKVVIAENVKGLLLGKAISYVAQIYKEFDKAGYYCQHFLLDASKMGVPQKRERVFFICIRHDLGKHFLKVSDLFNVEPYINMNFNEQPIIYGEFADYNGSTCYPDMCRVFDKRKIGDKCMSDAYLREHGIKRYFSQSYVYDDKVSPTLTAHMDSLIPFNKAVFLSKEEVCRISSFPLDYDFCNQQPHYICGMSVPPVMMAQVASRIYEYWLSKL